MLVNFLNTSQFVFLHKKRKQVCIELSDLANSFRLDIQLSKKVLYHGRCRIRQHRAAEVDGLFSLVEFVKNAPDPVAYINDPGEHS